MKTKKLLSILAVVAFGLMTVVFAGAGVNDRFATLELVDVTATATEINKLHSIGSGDVVTTTNTKTLTNKTLTSPTITSPTITGGVLTSSTVSGATMSGTISGGTYTTAAFTSPTITSPTITSAAFTGGTLTSSTLSGVTGTLSSPTVTSLDATFGVSTHEYTTNADWTLSASEAKSIYLSVTSGSTGVNIIAPNVSGRIYIVRVDTTVLGGGTGCTIKKSAGTGIAIASGKTATVIHNGSDYVRVTADQSH